MVKTYATLIKKQAGLFVHGTFTRCAAMNGQNTLGDRIAASTALYATMADPELGAVGSAFVSRIHAAPFSEVEAAQNQICNNVYIPFVWQEGFVNRISYKVDRSGFEEFTHSRCHELLHGLAWNEVPALHASIFNRNAHVVLSPRDWVRMFEMTEADVAAKTAWLMSLAAEKNPAIREATEYLPVSVREFESTRATLPDLTATLEVVAGKALHKNWGKDERDWQDWNFSGFYHWLALRDYENMINFYEASGITPKVVRLENHHMNAMGQSFGPNPFARGWFSHAPVKASEEAKIQQLNRRLGIYDEAALPTFENALAQMGETPQAFLERSVKNQPVQRPPLPQGRFAGLSFA